MQIDEAVARLPYKFKGKAVQVPTYFPVGHTLTENEAKFANRQLASVTGNVLASALNRLVDKKTEDNGKLADTDSAKAKDADGKAKVFTIADVTDTEAQALFDAIWTRYEPGVTATRDGSSVHDPVEAIANNIAWERIKVQLKARNIRVGSVKAEKKAELVKALRDKDPTILETAKAQVATIPPDTFSDDMFAGLPVGEATETGTETSAGGEDNAAASETGGPATEGTPENPGEATPPTEVPGSGDSAEGGAVNSEDITSEPGLNSETPAEPEAPAKGGGKSKGAFA